MSGLGVRKACLLVAFVVHIGLVAAAPHGLNNNNNNNNGGNYNDNDNKNGGPDDPYSNNNNNNAWDGVNRNYNVMNKDRPGWTPSATAQQPTGGSHYNDNDNENGGSDDSFSNNNNNNAWDGVNRNNNVMNKDRPTGGSVEPHSETSSHAQSATDVTPGPCANGGNDNDNPNGGPNDPGSNNNNNNACDGVNRNNNVMNKDRKPQP